MSMSDTTIRCHGCSFSGTITHRPITLRYRLPDGSVVDGYRKSGWCHRCREIRDIESRFDPAELQAEILQLKPNSGLFGKLFGAPNQDDIGDRRAKLVRLLRLATLRRSPPRCLTCGYTDVVDFQFDSKRNIVGFVHDCGRGLYEVPADPSAISFRFKPEVIELDVEGRPLSRLKEAKRPIRQSISDVTIIFGPPVTELLEEMEERAEALGKSPPEAWVWYIHKLIGQISERAQGELSDLDCLFTTALGVSVQVSEPFLTYTFHAGTIVPAIIMKPSDFSFPTGTGEINWEDPALSSVFGGSWKVAVGAEWTRVLMARFPEA